LQAEQLTSAWKLQSEEALAGAVRIQEKAKKVNTGLLFRKEKFLIDVSKTNS
jgi:hypothetical protein